MREILIGKVGKIVSGDDVGWYVKVTDDAADTGGFYILTSERSDMATGFDNWVESREDLESFFAESHWEIDWLLIK